MFRYGVAICAVCLGGLIAVADFAVGLPLVPPQQRGVPGKPSPAEDRLVFDACVTFYGIAYATGRLIYRWSGSDAEAELLRRWSRWHMAILNVMGGGWLIASGWLGLQKGVIRPSLAVGVLLLLLAAWDWWRVSRRVAL